MTSPVPFVHQVAGHVSTILASPTGNATLIKPASARERDFYTQLGPSLSDTFVGLWTPQFFGTLTLEGKMNDGGEVEKEGLEHELGKEMLVLENLTFRFARPNVLDIKLGTQLYDEDATEEKKQRMIKASQETTSGTTGVRLTGFQVWDSTELSYKVTPKTYGKSISPADLPEGFARFFLPLITSASPLLTPLLETILLALKSLIKAWSQLEIRMRGGSLLLVVEGDEKLLRAAMVREGLFPGEDGKLVDRSALARQSAQEEDLDSDDEGSVASSTDSQGAAKLETLDVFELRLIDFAHVSHAKGQGPDEGVLMGLRTVEVLIEGLLHRAV
ncbi:inositol-polyphosphate multikinase [Pseudohyphozyma bogoriensis]|nr:inositol-polyphosphate multikinase [Pseudohyphozyma bogoriensis]